MIVIVNKSSQTQTFLQESNNSSSSNRIVLGNSTRTLVTNQGIHFIYCSGLTIYGNSNQSRWVYIN